jgi:hypothetical protein
VCLLLLEITKFMRETYQYMPKKVSYQYNTGRGGGGDMGHHHLNYAASFGNNPAAAAAVAAQSLSSHVTGGGGGGGKNARSNRVVQGSVFSNDSSNMSLTGQGSQQRKDSMASPVIMPKEATAAKRSTITVHAEPSKISSASDNVSVTDNEIIIATVATATATEPVKHIHFAETALTAADGNYPSIMSTTASSAGSRKMSEENVSRHSGGEFVFKTGSIVTGEGGADGIATQKVIILNKRGEGEKMDKNP